MFLFDESPHILLNRMDGLGIDLREQVESGRVILQQIDPAEMSPGEFAHRIRAAAEEDKVSVLVIDSLNGYLNAMPEERFLTTHLHELLTYLGQRGVATIMVAVQHGLIGTAMQGPVDASYLADSIIMMRYFEANGEVRQALSVVKKRSGDHERTIREFRLGGPGGTQHRRPPARLSRRAHRRSAIHRRVRRAPQDTEDQAVTGPSNVERRLRFSFPRDGTRFSRNAFSRKPASSVRSARTSMRWSRCCARAPARS
jgi:circadian clock protein KaiC